MFVLQYNIYSLATFIAQLRKLKCPTFFQNFEKKKNKQMKHLKLDLEMFRSNFAGVCNENFFFFFFFYSCDAVKYQSSINLASRTSGLLFL